MKAPRFIAVCALLAAALVLRAEDKPAAPATPPPLPPDMTTYYVCLLTRGPTSGTGTAEERQKLQAGHMANIQRLHAAGKLLVAGPCPDGGDWRGIFIFKCASLEEAQALAATDPAIQAGRLKPEIHAWWTAKGNIKDPEFPPVAANTTP